MKRTQLTLFAALGVLVALVALVYAAIQGRQAARRQMRLKYFQSIVRAISNQCDTFGHLPASVHRDRFERPLGSWRFHTMSFVEQDVVGRFPEEYWLDPINFESVESGCSAFCFPRYGQSRDLRKANVSLVTGPGTPFDGRCWKLDDLDPDTILIVEVADMDYLWMEPGDLKIDEISPKLTAGLDGKGVLVGFADEQVWYLDASVPLADLKPFFTVAGARQFRREEKLGPYRRQ